MHGHRRAEGDGHAELLVEKLGDYLLLDFTVEADGDLAVLLIDAQVNQRVSVGQFPQRREQPAAHDWVDRIDYGFKRGGGELAGDPAGNGLPYPAAGPCRAYPAYPRHVAGPHHARPGPSPEASTAPGT